MNVVKIGKLAWDVEYVRNVKKVDNASIGKLLANRLPTMGPSFIKIGQFISTREDVFGKSLTRELAKLQDSSPPINQAYVMDKVKGLPLGSFVSDPIATASIGQVHKGTLQDGREVAIKVRRPNIEQEITNDFTFILKCLDLLKVMTDNRRVLELDMVFREYYNVLVEEIDFYREVENIKRFAINFDSIPWLKVPDVYPEYSNEDVIVMEFVPSIKVDALPKSYGKEACKNAALKIVQCYIMQISKYNLVHIDPHPGNLGVTANGKLVFYDYGMVLDLSKEKVAEQFEDFITYLFERDADALSNFLVQTGIIEVLPGNMPLFKAFIKAFIMYTDNMSLQQFKDVYLKQLEGVGGMPFFISSRFIMFLRGLAILEGVLKKVYPGYNYQEILEPFVPERVMSIDYFENRASLDIKAFQQLPSSLEMTQLQLEIMNMRLTQQKKIQATNSYATMGLAGMVAMLLASIL